MRRTILTCISCLSDYRTLKSIYCFYLCDKVTSVHNYGAFVSIPGQRKQGLVHRTQVSKVPVDDVTEVLQKGERVWCKIVNVTVSILINNIVHLSTRPIKYKPDFSQTNLCRKYTYIIFLHTFSRDS